MDRLAIIKQPVVDELVEFKKIFDRSLTSSNPLLQEVIDHIHQRNGKMMRPILVLLMAKLFGRVRHSTLHAAVALEILHTASLVHDDVVDESTERRGQLSVNAVYNNKVAVLVGDFLLASCLVIAGKTKDMDIIKQISLLGQNLAEGELLQLSNISNPVFSEEVYLNVIRKKTAALFSTCTQVAALSVEADSEQCAAARLFGEYIGICFQIRDDIFDYFDSEEIGKPTGNDMIEGKLTLPAIYALNSTHVTWAKEIAARIKDGDATPDEIKKLIAFTKENGGIEYAQKVMYKYRDKAAGLMEAVPDSPVKTSLLAYLDYVVNRIY
ncbi:polyprenyl synthetase family protein [Bacteroides sp. 51]|uniref:polyprenyl synthetase family protein n=1 Tax=Bacteroides sp. 51 TaxID=2302938 RepID=UPI0013CFF415|nr:polyprenyl synthetase family protein [Bacteroides sp. 51]NDV80554.1 polyprenyl synthetase family protein [Bacteroides sp. 51]